MMLQHEMLKRHASSMVKHWLIVAFIFIFENKVYAATDNVLVLSYSAHPSFEADYLPRIRDVYHQLGYEIAFVAVEPERAQRLLQSGMVDGDVARTMEYLESVKPPLIVVANIDKLSVSLFCKQHVLCGRELLMDANAEIFMMHILYDTAMVGVPMVAKKRFVRDWTQLQAMVEKGRVDRFIWPSSSYDEKAFVRALQHVSLDVSIDIYHVLQPKHKVIASMAAPLLREKFKR